MRTTITLPEKSIKSAKRLTGKRRLSDALQTLIDEVESQRAQVAATELLFAEPVPHDMEQIRAERRARDWSA